ncbi:TM2 domain-containing membrane protein YozV [Pseudomonas guineae]|uniref:TM2 domain-containing membrane protein YozV n=1 Tax=Pseudomonas guineae TaxID=425504 RepID=A0A1I3FQT1_9PSED|nr:TM2 domain-containing protein [Pseudomonas guineae]SFI13452.1 TM2 domain-containing membrane protein YozV [Pseudomonas guineae]|tara:strand:+ start:4540 stop:4980 length:441 start_codon:yes stop_codon:yes gene_type:complete
MKGKILDFNSNNRTGVISADDGNRYNFDMSQWKGSVLPKSGAKVDFSVNEGAAADIYQDQAASGSSKKIPAAILAFFLGAFGAHKFFLGYNKQGVIMLLTFIFGFILLGIPSMVIGVIAFVEFIIYLIKSDDEFENTYVNASKPWF